MTTATEALGLARTVPWTGSVIDVDVHANVPSIQTLYPYLSDLWIDWCEERGYKGPGAGAGPSPPVPPRPCAPRWRPEKGMPASSVEQLREHVLDPWGVEHAIVNC